jgi:DNA polymerase
MRPGGKPMRGFPPAEDFFPSRRTLAALARAVDGCRACPLYRNATQGVFGEGPRDARLMMVGEQPGDQEDVQGRPFVGAAGRLLDQCLAEAGIPREEVWLTNAAKHFKFEERGKRRIHKKPTSTEVQACFPWLEVEIEKVAPEMIVCLGATATRALLGDAARVERDHGKPFSSPWAAWVMPTYHPSALLRAPEDQRQRARETFIADLREVAEHYRMVQARSARIVKSIRQTASGVERGLGGVGHAAAGAAGGGHGTGTGRRAR